MSDLIDRQITMDAIAETVVNGECLGCTLAEDILYDVPSAQLNNQVHLCNSCKYKNSYPVCPSGKDDVIFGNGVGNDNICACACYTPDPEVIRCRDCRYNDGTGYCEVHFMDVSGDSFCSWGEATT